MKPSSVEITTTAIVQTTVFFSTMENFAPLRTFSKFLKPMKPLTRPALVTWLKAIRKTNPMGMMMKTNIRMMLGRIHR